MTGGCSTFGVLNYLRSILRDITCQEALYIGINPPSRNIRLCVKKKNIYIKARRCAMRFYKCVAGTLTCNGNEQNAALCHESNAILFVNCKLNIKEAANVTNRNVREYYFYLFFF